jgi:hypothetical protein
MKKWAKELNRAFSKEEAQMAKKTHEEMLNIPGHKGNANQRFYLIPIRMTTIKNTTTNIGKDVRKKESSYTAGGNIN